MFLQGAQAEASLVFGLAGLARGARRGVRAGLGALQRFGRADRVGSFQASLGRHVLFFRPLHLFVGSACDVSGSFGLGVGGLRGRLCAGQLLRLLRALRVLLAQGLQGVVRLADAAVQVGVRLAELLGDLRHAGLGGLGLRRRFLVVGANGQHGGCLVASLDRPLAQHVAARRDDSAHTGQGEHFRRNAGGARDDPIQEGRQGRGAALARGDTAQPHGALGQVGLVLPLAERRGTLLGRRGRGVVRAPRALRERVVCPCDDEAQRSPGSAGRLKLAQASGEGVHDNGVGEGGERRGDGVLVAGRDVQEGRHLPEDAGAAQQLGGAVLGGEQLSERVAARLPARAIGAGLALDAEQVVHASSRGVAAGRGLGVSLGGSPAGLGRGGRIHGSGGRAIASLAPGRPVARGQSRGRCLGSLLRSPVCAPRALGLGAGGLQA